MSNPQKANIINRNFGIQSFCGGHCEISLKFWFKPNGRVCPEFWFSNLSEFPTAVAPKSLIFWGRIMDHQKAERVAYHNGIQDFWSLSQSETQKLSSVQPWFCPETEISIEVDLQNSVSSKPLVKWGWISNQWKDRRVLQAFGIHLRGRIPTEQPQNWFFFRRCNLYRNEVFSCPVIFRKS
jgi:hypothetical protein